MGEQEGAAACGEPRQPGRDKPIPVAHRREENREDCTAQVDGEGNRGCGREQAANDFLETQPGPMDGYVLGGGSTNETERERN